MLMSLPAFGPLAMFGLGAVEIAVVAIIGLLLFGSQLPKLARNAGKGIREFRDEVKEIKNEVTGEADPSAKKDQLPAPKADPASETKPGEQTKAV